MVGGGGKSRIHSKKILIQSWPPTNIIPVTATLDRVNRALALLMNKIPTRCKKNWVYFLFVSLLYMFRALHSPILRSLNFTSRYGVTGRFFRRSVCQIQNSCTEGVTFCTAVLDLTHTSPKKPTYTVTPYLLVQLRLLRMGECSARNM
jgi:hypothetical protein